MARFQLGRLKAKMFNRRIKKIRAIYALLRDAANACVEGDIFSHSAALAYYTVFAIAPMFVIALAIAGFCFGQQAASRELFGQINQLIGKEGGEAIQSMVSAANKGRTGFFATSIAVATLLVASTGVFAQLQNSLRVCLKKKAWVFSET